MRDTLALVLAGGRGTRLGPLTARCAKPAVPIAGHYRLIDFTLSNCMNSGIAHIGVLTQYLAESLHAHVAAAWGERDERGDRSVACLRASAGDDEIAGYRGTADAVFQNLALVRAHAPSHVLVLAGDHFYKMDYRGMLQQHLRCNAELTVGCVEVPLAEARGFGVMQVDDDQRIRSFVEKPAQPQPRAGRRDVALASMGIYLFDTRVLIALLTADAGRSESGHDFGKDVIPAAIHGGQTYAYSLRDPSDPQRQGYWRDVGTIDSYWRSNLDMTGDAPAIDTEDQTWPIRSSPWGRPAASRRIGIRGEQSVVAAGCVMLGAELRRSILFPGVQVAPGARVQESVLLPGVTVAQGCLIRNAVIEEGCEIPEGMVVGLNRERDRRRFQVSEAGTVLVTRNMLRRDDNVSYRDEGRIPAYLS